MTPGVVPPPPPEEPFCPSFNAFSGFLSPAACAGAPKNALIKLAGSPKTVAAGTNILCSTGRNSLDIPPKLLTTLPTVDMSRAPAAMVGSCITLEKGSAFFTFSWLDLTASVSLFCGMTAWSDGPLIDVGLSTIPPDANFLGSTLDIMRGANPAIPLPPLALAHGDLDPIGCGPIGLVYILPLDMRGILFLPPPRLPPPRLPPPRPRRSIPKSSRPPKRPPPPPPSRRLSISVLPAVLFLPSAFASACACLASAAA